jgi:hypothetical protein
MATLDLSDVRPKDDLADVRSNGHSLAEDRLSTPAEDWAPPLAPLGDEDTFLAPQAKPPKADCRHCNRCGIVPSGAYVLLPGLARGETIRGNREDIFSSIFSHRSAIHPRLRCSRLLLWLTALLRLPPTLRPKSLQMP